MELDLRGTDLQSMLHYLTLLGGTPQGSDRVVGPGWSASLQTSVHLFRAMEFPRVIVRLEGEAAAVAEVGRKLKLMAMRGGG